MAKQDTPAELPQAPFVVTADKLAEHQADLARRHAEDDANREEMLKCCNPDYAKQREDEKPTFVWTIDVDWYAFRPKKGVVNLHKKGSVVVTSEQDAWALFCDKLGTWPCRRDVKITFKKGKQLTAAESAAAKSTSTTSNVIPRVEFKSKEELDWVEVA